MANAKKKKKTPLKVEVMVDPFGGGEHDGTDEFEALKAALPALLPAHDIAIERKHCMFPDSTADLVIYDFGGMMPGADDLIASNARNLGKFIQDHPSSLVVVISRFTYSRLRFEFIDAGLIPEDDSYSPSSVYEEDNVQTPFQNMIVTVFTVEMGFHSDEDVQRIRAWFSEKGRS